MNISRRRFFRESSLLTASALSIPGSVRAVPGRTLAPGQKPRHIIHLVADGMSLGTLTGADHLSLLLRRRGLVWTDLLRRPETVSAWMNMRSLNSLVTDSAAAASSWGSGSRVVNGIVNLLPDGRELRTLYELFGQAGWQRGLVTTTEITHATPAGFAAISKREDAENIARQYLDRRIEVLLGGGRKFFEAKTRKDKQDLCVPYRQQGYVVLETLSDLEAASRDQRWLGLFTASHLPFTLDHLADAKACATIPSLVRMTERALDRLRNAPHFILQVEGGRVDHGAHNCDAAAALRDQIAFDEALEVCLDFQRQEPDTLVVTTTDHGNGNPGLNGMGAAYGSSSPLFAHLLRFKRSFAEMFRLLDKSVEPKRIAELIEDSTGYAVPAKKAAFLAAIVAKKETTLYEAMNSGPAQLGQLLANYCGVGWTSGAHTADYVPLVAIGPGAERFRGILENTDVFHHYLKLAGIDYRNPSVPLLAECGPGPSHVEPVDSYWTNELIA